MPLSRTDSRKHPSFMSRNSTASSPFRPPGKPCLKALETNSVKMRPQGTAVLTSRKASSRSSRIRIDRGLEPELPGLINYLFVRLGIQHPDKRAILDKLRLAVENFVALPADDVFRRPAPGFRLGVIAGNDSALGIQETDPVLDRIECRRPLVRSFNQGLLGLSLLLPDPDIQEFPPHRRDQP